MWLKNNKNKHKHMKYYLLLIAGLLFISSCKENKAAQPKIIKAENKQSATPPIQEEKPTELRLPAQLAAYEEVSIFPKVNGYVKTVLVDVGSKVSKGQLLMELEAPELEQASLQAKEKYTRARADFLLDKERFRRLQEAAATPGAVSPLDLSTIKAKMDADSALCNAEKNNWQMQQTMQTYLRVTAPFNGVITERNVHPGALVSATAKDKPLLELKQIDRLRLQVDVSEAVAATIKNGDTVSFYVNAFPGKKMIGHISRESMNINTQFRLERVEIDVMNKDGALMPGMYADVLLPAAKR